MPVNRDAIGLRGEAIVALALTRRHGCDEPLFRPQFLGDKYPAIDFLVESVGVADTPVPFFVAQAKTTSSGYTAGGRLKARATPTEVTNLLRYPAPSYLIGVDEVGEIGFLVPAVMGGPAQYRSMPTDPPLASLVTLEALFNEVVEFWRAHGATFGHSAFA